MPAPDRVAVIGAGPIGLAAAANLILSGLRPVVFEAGDAIGWNVLRWRKVRLFSPWGMNIDPAARTLLQRTEWQEPNAAEYPTGHELVSRYLAPLSRVPEIANGLWLQTRVVSITRCGYDRLRLDEARRTVPFRVRVSRNGAIDEHLVSAVIDASGTYASPNPLGAEGVPAIGEDAAGDRVFYGIPDIAGRDRDRFAGRRVVVAGSGHSALQCVRDLAELRREAPSTRIVWAVRRDGVERLLMPRPGDVLPARGILGDAVRAMVEAGEVQVETGFHVLRVDAIDGGITLRDGERSIAADQVIAATGFRPDFGFARELRLQLDHTIETTPALAPLVDPNLHSCATVPRHGARELAHPEENFFIAGMKSYGRAPTFLLQTGYEQVRSVVSLLANGGVSRGQAACGGAAATQSATAECGGAAAAQRAMAECGGSAPRGGCGV